MVATSLVTPLLLKVPAVFWKKAMAALPTSALRPDSAIDRMAYRAFCIKMVARTRAGHPQVVQSFVVVSISLIRTM